VPDEYRDLFSPEELRAIESTASRPPPEDDVIRRAERKGAILCVACGVAVGELYPDGSEEIDSPRTVTMGDRDFHTLAPIREADGWLCGRCRKGRDDAEMLREQQRILDALRNG